MAVGLEIVPRDLARWRLGIDGALRAILLETLLSVVWPVGAWLRQRDGRMGMFAPGV